MSARSVAAFALACTLAAACGCNQKARSSGPRTPGQIALADSRLKLEQANMMLRGERMVVRGRTRKARGEAWVEQGKRVSGAREARKGELLIRWGQALIDVAREMETEFALPDAPEDVAPSTQQRSPQ